MSGPDQPIGAGGCKDYCIDDCYAWLTKPELTFVPKNWGLLHLLPQPAMPWLNAFVVISRLPRALV